jgi:hypothetical protein
LYHSSRICSPLSQGLKYYSFTSGFPRLNLNQIPYFFHTFSILFPTATLKKKKTEKKFFGAYFKQAAKNFNGGKKI